MRKPIFVLQLQHLSDEDLDRITKELQLTEFDKDYHYFVVSGEENKFQLFSDKEIEPIKLKELQKIVGLKLKPA